MKSKHDKYTRDAFPSHGGQRPGAGRKPLPLSERKQSRVVRVPLEFADDVQAFVDSMRHAQSTVSVQRQRDREQEDVSLRIQLKAFLQLWADRAEGREKMPRWAHVSELLQQLRELL